MAPSKIRKALGAVKDQTSISIAKVSNNTSISILDVAIVKATRHNEYPAEERHIREILSLTCYSRAHISQCVSTLSRRLNKTRSWTVALKTLILVHRLLSEGDPTCEQEIFFTTRRGTRMLNMSDFRDTKCSSRGEAWDYSAFVRTYARYLDEMLEYRMHGRRKGRRRSRSQQMHEDVMVVMDEEERERERERDKALVVVGAAGAKVNGQGTPVREMTTEEVFARTQHLQQQLERFLACRPTGAAKNNRIVAVALYPLLKESGQLYYDLQEVMSIFVDRFEDLQLPDRVRVFDIFTRLSKQLDDLDRFYSWAKSSGVSRPSDLPTVDRVTQQKLELMGDFIRQRADDLDKNPSAKSLQQLTDEEDARREAEAAAADAAGVKALPAPEPKEEEEVVVQGEEEETVAEEPSPSSLAIVKAVEEEEVDFLNLRDDTVTVDRRENDLALALFDGTAVSHPPAPVWEAFADEADWETALVESASSLSGQRAALGGGFDMLLLDGMYSQPPQQAFSDGSGSGSASSVAPPPPPPRMLALPAPRTAEGSGGDPFAASLSVPAPSYVQMAELEKKRRLLVEEQVMWQQYAKDGMQGQVSIAHLQQAAGYVQRF